ncbi:MAG: hypothetical protein HFF44_03275 [Lawsonibacter sp.]|nr:hypothetical protein [Lawsonibacter sp.]
MKRIKAECLEQTLHFLLKDGFSLEEARQQVQQEYKTYRAQLDRRGTLYKVLEESEQPDGSLIIKIKRQNNYHPVGGYLD